MRRLPLVIAAAVVVAAVIAALVLSGGGDSANGIGDGDASGGFAAPSAPPATGGGGGGANAGPPPPTAEPPTAARLRAFRKTLRARCRKVGTATAISAGGEGGPAREREMAREIEYLRALQRAIAGVRAPTDKMRTQLAAYRRRLDAQIDLDKLIKRAAHGEDERSVQVGMEENAHNRDGRTAAADAMGVTCLRAAAPR
jgi:hypothetical protein